MRGNHTTTMEEPVPMDETEDGDVEGVAANGNNHAHLARASYPPIFLLPEMLPPVAFRNLA